MRILVILLILQSIGCTRSPVTGKGLEIYQVDRAYPDFTSNERVECYYCLDVATEDLYPNPTLTERDIKHFNWVNQQIELTEEAKRRITDIEIPLQGLPMAMVLNGEIIYSFWFWNVLSSFGCDRVLAYTELEFKIEFGLPRDNTYGVDPRFDSRLEKYVTEKMNRN